MRHSGASRPRMRKTMIAVMSTTLTLAVGCVLGIAAFLCALLVIGLLVPRDSSLGDALGSVVMAAGTPLVVLAGIAGACVAVWPRKKGVDRW